MNLHFNAKTCPNSRLLMVRRLEQGWTVRAVAAAHGISERTVRKWRRRFRLGAREALLDGSSRPHRSPRQTPAGLEERILQLRAHRTRRLRERGEMVLERE